MIVETSPPSPITTLARTLCVASGPAVHQASTWPFTSVLGAMGKAHPLPGAGVHATSHAGTGEPAVVVRRTEIGRGAYWLGGGAEYRDPGVDTFEGVVVSSTTLSSITHGRGTHEAPVPPASIDSGAA